MSDIDSIWESEYIINNLLWSKDRIKNKKELSYLLRYQMLCSHYYKSNTKAESEYYEKELARLENMEIIKEIVKREGPEDLILEMTFAKTTLNKTDKKTTQKPNKKYYIISGFIGLLLGILYLVGMAELPYIYYQLLRFISFISIPVFIYSYWHISGDYDLMDKIDITHIIVGAIWILFNPLLPVQLNKDLWIFFDFVSAMTFLALDIYLVILYRRENNVLQKHTQTNDKTLNEEVILLDDEELKKLYETDFDSFWKTIIDEAERLNKIPNSVYNHRTDRVEYGENATRVFLNRMRFVVEGAKWEELMKIKHQLMSNNSLNEKICMLDVIGEYEHQNIVY